MTRFRSLNLKRYGTFEDLNIKLGDGLTVVHGNNEAGKSTARDALVDFLCGIPTRSPRASAFGRPKLLIEVEMAEGDRVSTWQRNSREIKQTSSPTGEDAPWNRGEQIDRNWWSTRFALDHEAMRRGGAEVLRAAAGESDIAELIFVARRGEFARETLRALEEELEEIFHPDGRKRKAQIRLALQALAAKEKELADVQMKSGEVLEIRGAVEKTEADLRKAKAELREAERSYRRAENAAAVMDHVVDYLVGERELADLDAEGPRLEAAELQRFQEAVAVSETAGQAAGDARDKIASLRERIDQLTVDVELLASEREIDGLYREVNTRLEQLRDLAEKHTPETEQLAIKIRTILSGLGVTLDGDLEDALNATRVPTDIAATLDDLAERITDIEDSRSDSRDRKQTALANLAELGITTDPDAGSPISKTAVSDAIRELRRTREIARDHDNESRRLRGQVSQLETELDRPPIQQGVTRHDVGEARTARDAAWEEIRNDWVSQDQIPVETRSELADELTRLIHRADETGDREAEERASVSAYEAVSEVHDNRLADLRSQLEASVAATKDASAQLQDAEEKWVDLWDRAGVQPPPDVDDAAVVENELTTMRLEDLKIRDFDERLAELQQPWSEAAKQAGLPTSATPATWRARAGELDALEQLRHNLEQNRASIEGIEQRWSEYQDRALRTLAAFDPGAKPQSPEEIARAVRKLHDTLGRQKTNQELSLQLHGQLEEQLEVERETSIALRQSEETIHSLREAHGVDDVSLRLMAQRGLAASAPTDRMDGALKAIQLSWKDATPLQVIHDLRDRDHTDVEAERADLEDEKWHAEIRVHELSEQLGSQKRELEQAESKTGADEIREQISQSEAEIASLAERWMHLRLQAELLNRVIESQGGESVSPLLHEAGRILERLTGGRWVALHPEPGHGVRALKIIRADEEEAKPEELSEGTLDQVYLALRLAAVKELHQQRIADGKPELPLVLDDVLMAFDPERTRSALGELSELAREIQIILFTHHGHVADLARELDGVQVSDLPTPGVIEGFRDAEQIRTDVPTFG